MRALGVEAYGNGRAESNRHPTASDYQLSGIPSSMEYSMIHSLGRSACAASFCVLAATALAQQAPAMSHPASMPMGQMHKDSMGSADMRQAMASGMEGMQKMSMSGDVDKDFAMMMKMHHQQALQMAEMELKHGKSAAMKTMAKRIIVAQKREIAEFDRWLAKHK